MPCRGPEPADFPYDKPLEEVLKILNEFETGNYGIQYKDIPLYTSKQELDEKIAKLCSMFQQLTNEQIKAMSLEAQIWWRDHQKLDQQRILNEFKEKLKEEDKQKALAKLTPYERKLLGL